MHVLLRFARYIVKSLSDGMPNITDRRSFGQIWDAWRVKKNSTADIKVVYCAREYEFIKLAHDLANQGRRCKWDRQGINLPIYDEGVQL